MRATTAGTTGRLVGEVAAITGAGSGMGKAAALSFAAEGAKVVCVERGRGRDAVAVQIGEAAVAVPADIQ